MYVFASMRYPVGPVLSGEVRQYFRCRSLFQKFNVIFTDLPTLKARVDDPQSRRGSGHHRCERSRGLIHGRKTAREASQRTRVGRDL